VGVQESEKYGSCFHNSLDDISLVCPDMVVPRFVDIYIIFALRKRTYYDLHVTRRDKISSVDGGDVRFVSYRIFPLSKSQSPINITVNTMIKLSSSLLSSLPLPAQPTSYLPYRTARQLSSP
jgi:hypothetical protein